MPDLNSVPESPRSLAGSRRASAHQMPAPDPSLNILPSNQNTINQSRRQSNASMSSPRLSAATLSQNSLSSADGGVVSGPGPIRHPRPMTAAELHVQLEKEQEAVVNRLTRELQLLRAAHNSSTVSNASSTSAGNTPVEQNQASVESGLLSSSGFSIPSGASRRHNRTSSSASARSTAATMGSGIVPTTTTIPIRSNQAAPIPISRQNSSTSHRSLVASSPAMDPIAGPNYFHGSQRTSAHLSGSLGSQHGQGHDQPLSPGLMPGTTRYEETIHHREQLDVALQENEALKKRIRDLERMLRERRRSVSSSTMTSTGGVAGTPVPAPTTSAPQTRPGMDRERSMTATSTGGQSVSSLAVGVPEEEIKVGDSASSSAPAQG